MAHFVGKLKESARADGGWVKGSGTNPPGNPRSPPGVEGLGGREEPYRVFWEAPAFRPARQLYHDFIKKSIEKTTNGVLSTPRQDPVGGAGLRGGFSVPGVAETSGHLQEVPWPLSVPLPLSEALSSETVIIKTRLALSVGSFFFSLTYDQFHHMLLKKMQGRIADKFVSTANCSVIYLFHKWLLSSHYLQSPKDSRASARAVTPNTHVAGCYRL